MDNIVDMVINCTKEYIPKRHIPSHIPSYNNNSLQMWIKAALIKKNSSKKCKM